MVGVFLHVAGILLICIFLVWYFFDLAVVPVSSFLAVILSYRGFLMKNKLEERWGAILVGDISGFKIVSHVQVEAGKGGRACRKASRQKIKRSLGCILRKFNGQTYADFK